MHFIVLNLMLGDLKNCYNIILLILFKFNKRSVYLELGSKLLINDM